MSILNIKAENAQLELRHPITDEPLGATVLLAGTDSKEFYNAVKVQQKQNKSTDDLDAQRRQWNEVLASCIKGWSPDEEFEGAFTKERALEILSEPELGWMREQIDKFIAKRGNFIKG